MSKLLRVMIDPGHGPGNQNRGPTDYYEYQGMWALSSYLKSALERCDIKADLTRKEDENPGLEARGKAAKGYDLFISEHSNAFDGTVRGCEVFYSVKQKNNKKYAAALSKAAATLMGNKDRGAKTRAYSTSRPDLDYYGVMRAAVAAGCPRVFIAESGFHDHPVDEAWLKQDSNLKALAEAQAEVICGILGVKYVKEAPKAIVHIIQPKDTYIKIGEKYGIDYKLLMQWNPWPATGLPIGAPLWLAEVPQEVLEFTKKVVDLEKKAAELERKIVAAQEALT